MITICLAGEQGQGKSCAITLLAGNNAILQNKKIISTYSPPHFQKIIDIVKPKKYSYPQIEFSEITIERKATSLTKYALNIYNILIFIKSCNNLKESTIENEATFFVECIKNTDLLLLKNRVEKLMNSLKFKHSETEAAELHSLQHLINSYENNEMLEYNKLDKISKHCVRTFGLLSFKPINIFINTPYNAMCNKFNKIVVNGLNINTFITDFSLYSDLIKESRTNPNIFKEFQVDDIDVTQILIALLKQSNIIHFYTIVSNDIRAWQIVKGTPVKEAGGKIHKDFEKGFISADVIKADDFINANGEIKKLKALGKVYNVNKDYTVCDEDIITFKFNI